MTLCDLSEVKYLSHENVYCKIRYQSSVLDKTIYFGCNKYSYDKMQKVFKEDIWWQKCIFSLLPCVIWNEWLSQTIISIFIVPIFRECMYACNLLSRYIVERKCQRHKLNHCHPLKWVRAKYIQQNFSNKCNTKNSCD